MKNFKKLLNFIAITVFIGFFTTCEEPSSNPHLITGSVDIVGIAVVGQILTADVSKLGGSGDISYQWKRSGINIGINNNSYIVQLDDVGSTISVTVTRSNNSGSITSDQTAVVINIPLATEGLYYTLINGNSEYSVSLGAAVAVGEIIIPAIYNGLSVTAITNNGFYFAVNMTSIIMPESIKNIGSNAFSNSGLTSIKIPNSVTSIGANAFLNCVNLTSVTFLGIITTGDFSSTSTFPGDLRNKYFAVDGGIGTYFRQNGTITTWIGAPTAFITNVTSNSITFSWNYISEAIRYILYRSSSVDGIFKEIGTTEQTVYTDTELAEYSRYFYKVVAIYNNGKSPQSNINSITSIEIVQIPSGDIRWESSVNSLLTNVTISLSTFKMSKYEVTQEQYEAVMGVNPSSFNDNPAEGEVQGRRPVEMVTWYDAIEFCNKLSVLENFMPVYTITNRMPTTGYPITSATITVNWNANGYRLPTRAQREYACSAGSTTVWHFDHSIYELENYVWYNENANEMTHEVGLKLPNSFGLYDMSGNVSEWCWDGSGSSMSPNPTTDQTDYTEPVSGIVTRVCMGGSFREIYTATYSRDWRISNPNERYNFRGFRVVRP